MIVFDESMIHESLCEPFQRWVDHQITCAVKDRDIEWWQACCLVDNVAPTPEAVKDWLLQLSAYEQQELKDDNARLRAENEKLQALRRMLESKPLSQEEAEIKRLRARITALEQAAQPFADLRYPDNAVWVEGVRANDCRNLRRVLEDKG